MSAPSTDAAALDALAINTIRTLTIDAVEKAQSGHPGAPMAMAPVAYTLWSRYLRYDPANPTWPNRDRFVLSAGHGSMLLYSLLHLAGVRAVGRDGLPLNRAAVTLDDIKSFRELDSVCAGHPEYGLASGIETTTGPLGQGAANSVGMAIAARWLAARHNTLAATLFDYNVYALCSDGDLMEGVAAEAASLAGHLRLSNLCWLWDDNAITIEGHTNLAFTEDVAARFRGYGWAIQVVDDANDVDAVCRALDGFLATDDRPTLIVVKSVIGFGSPNRAGTSKAHSDPLGAAEIKLIKRAYGWPEDAHFLVPDGVREHVAGALANRGGQRRADWAKTFEAFAAADPRSGEQLRALWRGDLPGGWDVDIPVFPASPKGVASREASGAVLNAVAQAVPWLVGGSADLAPSNKTRLEFAGAGEFGPGDPAGRNLHFGVREHAMGAAANGMALCGLRAYAGTFLIFSDYMKPAIRLAALMELPAIFVFTHDSIGVGQDGPTHQPIEQLAGLRAIPNLLVLRPADANETAEAWRVALSRSRTPTCLILSRQALPTVDRATHGAACGLAKGGYILADAPGGDPQVILIASGAEVSLCLCAHEALLAEGVASRVVSMPSFALFEVQDLAYRRAVLPPAVIARVAVEAASPLGWDRYAGTEGEIIAMRSFGASGPIGDLMTRFGFTVEAVVAAAHRQMRMAPDTPR